MEDATLSYYRRVAQLDSGELGIQARLSVMRLIANPILARWDPATTFYPTLQELLPPGRATVLAYVGLADSLIALRTNSPNPASAGPKPCAEPRLPYSIAIPLGSAPGCPTS